MGGAGEIQAEGSGGKNWSEGAGLRVAPSRPGNFQNAADDQQLKDIMDTIRSTKSSAVVNYGASWCRVCCQILPVFSQLSNEFPKLSFVYADIDECPETTQQIRFTPTFQFFRDGERVDEMMGTGKERLRDRLWLHS
ncbi:thioredoxin superfamily protein [Wolffia australiana]